MIGKWKCTVCPGTLCEISYSPPDEICYYCDGDRKPIWMDRYGWVYKPERLSNHEIISIPRDKHDRWGRFTKKG